MAISSTMSACGFDCPPSGRELSPTQAKSGRERSPRNAVLLGWTRLELSGLGSSNGLITQRSQVQILPRYQEHQVLMEKGAARAAPFSLAVGRALWNYPLLDQRIGADQPRASHTKRWTSYWGYDQFASIPEELEPRTNAWLLGDLAGATVSVPTIYPSSS